MFWSDGIWNIQIVNKGYCLLVNTTMYFHICHDDINSCLLSVTFQKFTLNNGTFQMKLFSISMGNIGNVIETMYINNQPNKWLTSFWHFLHRWHWRSSEMIRIWNPYSFMYTQHVDDLDKRRGHSLIKCFFMLGFMDLRGGGGGWGFVSIQCRSCERYFHGSTTVPLRSLRSLTRILNLSHDQIQLICLAGVRKFHKDNNRITCPYPIVVAQLVPVNKMGSWDVAVDRYHCRQTSYVSGTLVCNEIVEHSDVVGASPVGTAPTTSSFLTEHLASVDWAKATSKQGKKHLNFGIWMWLILEVWRYVFSLSIHLLALLHPYP